MFTDPRSNDTKQPQAVWFNEHRWLARVLIVCGLSSFLVMCTFTSAQAHTVRAQSTPGATDPLAGLVRDINLCGTGFLIEGTDLCTHGPDYAFPNLALTEVSPITCDGDGISGKRVQVMYVRTSLDADGYDQNLALFRRIAAEVDQAIHNSAQATGDVRQVRFVTDAACQVDVLNVVIPPVVDLTFSTMLVTLRLLGYNDPDRKYLMFVDTDVYCGIGTVINDDSPSSDNRSNHQAGFARIDRSCWTGGAATHELVHTLGGVQQNAPNTSGGWHCTDEWDVMCYSDAPNYPALHYICPLLHDLLLDCNHDDYFHTRPPAGSYLATHWNVANSAFLFTPNLPPIITLTTAGNTVRFRRPATITITAEAMDSDGQVTSVIFFKNATLFATSTVPPYQITWTEETSGNITISAIAYDDDNAAGYAEALVLVVEDPDNGPPTATPTPSPTAIPTPLSTATTTSPTTTPTTISGSPTATLTPTATAATPPPTATNFPGGGTPSPTPSPNEPKTFIYNATQGRNVTLHIPSGALDEPTQLVFNLQTTPSHLTVSHFQFAGFTFVLSAYQSGEPVAGFTFLQPATLTLTYTDADVDALDENQLTLFFYDAAMQQWSQAGITVLQRDLANNRLTLEITHLAEFALGIPNALLYLPLVNGESP